MLDADRTGESIKLDQFTTVVSDESRKHEEPTERRSFNLDRELQKSRATAIEVCVELAERFELRKCVHVMMVVRIGYCICELPKRNASEIQVGIRLSAHYSVRSSTRVEVRVETDSESRIASRRDD